jgi:hypothetical protein
MKNIYIIILTIILIAPLPFACIDEISKYGNSKFKIDSLDIIAGKIESENRFYIQPINFDTIQTDTLISSQFGIAIKIAKVSNLTELRIPKGSFISQSMADPVFPRSASKVSLISIFSSQPVFANGKTYDAMENLTQLFNATYNYYNFAPQPILKFIESFDNWTEYNDIVLTLPTPLDQPLTQKLKVIVKMDDGTVFELETEKVVVK